MTERAARQALEMLAKKGTPDGAIRVKVTTGGCSGLSYNLEPAAGEPLKGEHVIQAHGLKVYLDPKSVLYVAGTTLDYEKTLIMQRFVFKNPQAKSTCSCGESFTV